MTVIAFDGKLLVADGRALADTFLVADNFNKLFEVNVKNIGPCVVGVAGACDVIGPFIKLLEKDGIDSHFPSDLDESSMNYVRALVVPKSDPSKPYEVTSFGGFHTTPNIAAIGSGELIAIHYLRQKHSAVVAVQEATKTMMCCGGEIVVFDTEKWEFV